MQAVFHQIGGHGIAESVEEIGANADERKINPGLVLEQVGKGLEGELLCPHRFQALLRQKAAGQGAQRGHGAQDHAQDGVLMLGVSPHHPLEVREGKQHHKAHGIGAHHPVGGELVLLVVVIRHYAQKGPVRHIHRRVHHHHQQVHRVGIDTLSGRPQVRGIEQQGEHQAQRNGAKNEPGPIGSPARPGAVCNGTHHRVRNHIEQAGDQHEGRRIGHGEAEDIGEKERKSDGHNLPGDSAGGGVTQGITNFLG